MPRRLVSIVLVAVLAGVSLATFKPLEAAALKGGKIAETRLARLNKRVRSSSQSSASSFDAVAWELFRMGKRRTGGGHPPAPVSSSSSAVTLVTPSITFGDIVKNFGNGAFTLSPVSNSNGAFSFVSGNTAVATVAGDTVTIVGAGTSVITATQAASGNYRSTDVTAMLTVNTIAPSIIALISISKNPTDLPFALSDPASNSAGAFTFTSTNPAVATVSGRIVTIRGAGTATIISTQAANGNYKSGSATTVLTVSPGLEEADAADRVHYGVL